ncbi:(d)CMP kinase [[Mycoplasma] testudinis]|uniref:(d)CMP kinase n=1 Tax=[Mycoplasma] testudinis TaxID=33924 RepID=UPI000485AC61|nr:(d)CMP kinase [[Mycoplasma] testudinis]
MFQIAIDGPSASGKTTIGLAAARKLEFNFLSTGLVYRAIAYIYHHDKLTLCELLSQIEKRIILGNNHVLIDGIDLGTKLQTEQVSAWTSSIATNQAIRKIAVKMQQEFAANKNVIMDGRDICSVVLPNAQVKVYIDADVKIRAKRRLDQLNLPEDELPKIIADLKTRDERDSRREVAPLKKDINAYTIDTSYLTISECVDAIEKIYLETIERK